ncbi:SDR family NAD(P)-dependent oxidoreductase [Nocardia sp. BMG51109]|uniref:SDR family NAD(P)-dependent oxidoreductase n=1 Tax=Nocardia sp. BMG51109 TaxID=1056816 RepID=UPI00046384AC|nr:SDR family oxidoreductase [Nocardia sp. BMG51109]
MTGERLLPGRGAVVVGGGSGIGRAVAELLAAQGAGVIVNSRSENAVHEVAGAIEHAGGRAAAVAGSAADEKVADRLIDRCVAEFGSIDILVNCAAVAESPRSSILDITVAEWRSLLDAHLTTAFNTCRAAAPRMVAQRGGAIVNTGSFAYLGDYGGTGYPAGKGAVTSLTLALAAELKEHGVRANVVCPGARTRLSTGADYEEQIRELHRRGMLDEMTMHGALDAPPPEYAAAVYLYLASSAAAAVTGEVLIAAGGFVGKFARPTPTPLGFRDHNESPPWEVDDLARMIGG